VCAARLAGFAQHVAELAVHALQIDLAVHVGHGDRVAARERVADGAGHHETLAVQRLRAQRLGEAAGARHHCHIKLASQQRLGQAAGHAFGQRQRDARMVGAEPVQEAHEAHRPDRGHRAEAETRILEFQEARGGFAGGCGAGQHLLEMRLHQPAELGHVRLAALAREQQAAQLGFDLLDRPRQRRLGDVAFVGRAGEVQRPADRQKIADFVKFHPSACPSLAPPAAV